MTKDDIDHAKWIESLTQKQVSPWLEQDEPSLPMRDPLEILLFIETNLNDDTE